ncbi:MAG: (d)CMP kinase [Methanotrichaceae archaeon]
MIITVSGSPGTGTTTLACELAKKLELPWVNSGVLFRKMASERKISIKKLGKLAEQSPEIDYFIDDAQKKLAEEGGGVFEGRLSGHILDADLKILLKADLKIRAKRIAFRENKLVDDALQECRLRETSEARRYKKYYNIDVNDFSVYDLVIDSDTWNEKGVLEIASAAVRALSYEKDPAV